MKGPDFVVSGGDEITLEFIALKKVYLLFP